MILITGSTGYIGSHLSLYFEKKNINFIGIDNLSYSYKKNVTKKQKHFFFDISNKKKVKNLITKYKPKIVIHCAACSYVLEGEKEKEKYYLNNVYKTKKFIDICKNLKIENFIFLSSSNVYSEKAKKLIFSEKDQTLSKNYYGKNKIQIEQYLNKTKFKKLIILRLFNIIGIFNKKFKAFQFKKINFQRLIFKLLQNFNQNKISKINIIKKNNKKFFPSRDFIDILDLSIILYKLINKISKESEIKEIFNIGSGHITSINKVVNIINKKFNNKLKIKYVNLPKKEFVSTKASINKIIKYLNYFPKIDVKKSIRSHYEKYK